MDEKLRKIFSETKYEASADLREKVWRALVLHQKRNATIKLWAFSFLGIFSLAALLPMLKTLMSDLSRSGFYEYSSLVFSDSHVIFSHFQEFAFSLAESLPVISLTLSLCLIFFFFLSIRYTTKQIIKNQLSF